MVVLIVPKLPVRVTTAWPPVVVTVADVPVHGPGVVRLSTRSGPPVRTRAPPAALASTRRAVVLSKTTVKGASTPVTTIRVAVSWTVGVVPPGAVNCGSPPRVLSHRRYSSTTVVPRRIVRWRVSPAVQGPAGMVRVPFCRGGTATPVSVPDRGPISQAMVSSSRSVWSYQFLTGTGMAFPGVRSVSTPSAIRTGENAFFVSQNSGLGRRHRSMIPHSP